MRNMVTRTILGLSGAMAFGIGAFILLDPQTFFAQNAVILDSNPDLLSEIRAPGGLLAIAGLVILFGAVFRRLTRTAQFTALSVFGAYGVSRAISIVLDGVPSTKLLSAMAIELLVAAVILFTIYETLPTWRGGNKETGNAQ